MTLVTRPAGQAEGSWSCTAISAAELQYGAVLGLPAGPPERLLTRAARHELERLHRETIDRQFEMMAPDSHYQREARRIGDEYGTSDWEALRVAEDDS